MRMIGIDWMARTVRFDAPPWFGGLENILPGVVSCSRSNGDLRHYRYFDIATGELLDTFNVPEAYYREGHSKEILAMQLEYLKKAKAKVDAAAAACEVTDATFSAKYPILFTFLCANADGDGQERLRSKVTMFADGGAWKGSLTDAETEQSLFVTLKSPESVYGALEKALAADEPDWRRWTRPAAAQKVRRELTKRK